ncbi:MAG: SusC/RagA family TonB-linked outer membrane protein [Chitinophagales bacterium]
MRKTNRYFSLTGYALVLLLFCFTSVYAKIPAQIITGKVTNANGGPVEGATVIIKGTTKGTTTNADGVFTLDAKKGDVLVISIVGYENDEVVVGNRSSVNVVLTSSKQELNTVIVTALGIKKQARAVGYSTTQIDGSKFTEARETNIGNALTGQVAGVSVGGVSTGPYGSSRVLIRGNSSLTGNNQPLYVVDNIPYDNSNQGNAGMWGGADYGDGLTNISPDDIENVTVLKGVAATALYGYRGGNGAILITTKSGNKSRGVGVEVNNNMTATRFIDERDYQYVYGQGSQGVKPTNIVNANASTESSWGAKIDGSDAVNSFGNTYKYVANKDNYKNFFKTGLTNQSSIALMGANDKGNFRLGISNLYLNSNIPNSDMKQQGLNFNTTYNITPKLQFTLTANYMFENVLNRASFSDAPGNLVASNQFIANTYDIRWLKARTDANRNELLPGDQDIYFENPYFIAYDDLNKTSRNRLTAGLTMKYNLLDWLYIQGSVTRDGYVLDTKQVTPNGVQYTNSGGGSINMSTVNQHELDGNALLGMHKNFGKDFVFSATAGVSTQDNIWTSTSGGGGPFVIPYFYSISNVSAKPFNYGYSHSRVNSILGSVDLGYKNFLFLTVTGRNDWFSVLNPKTNNYFYPSISGSFIFSDALKLPSVINYGKLRASFGGSSNTGAANPYETILTYGLQGYTSNGQAVGYVVNGSIPNQFLKPVTIQEQEVGFNLEFLNSRLGIDVAVYNKNTTNDIVTVSISNTSGYPSNTINIGKIRNRGIELLLTGSPIKSRNFNWNVSLNFAYNSNKVLNLGGSPSLTLDVPRNGTASVQAVVGLPYGQIVGTKFQRDNSGNIIHDTAGIPLPTTTLVPMGSGQYDKTGGLTNDFHYKNFSFSFLIDYKFGAKIYSGTNLILYNDGLQKGTLVGREGGFVSKGVTEDGHPNAKNVLTQTYFGALAAGSNNVDELFLYDASFIKLRSLSIGYSLPASVLKNGFIKGLSVSLVARNLAILMKHTPNIDPESNYNNSNAQGLELSGYPTVRSLGMNLNVKF